MTARGVTEPYAAAPLSPEHGGAPWIGVRPSLPQQRVAVGVVLRAVDPLPPVQERLSGEPGVLGCSL